MDVKDNFPERKLTFLLRQDEPMLLAKLSFIHLVNEKFSGKELECASFRNKGNDPYIMIVLQFPDHPTQSNAKAHCDQHLNDAGAVLDSYRGALRYADADQKIARNLQKRSLANRRGR